MAYQEHYYEGTPDSYVGGYDQPALEAKSLAFMHSGNGIHMKPPTATRQGGVKDHSLPVERPRRPYADLSRGGY